MANDPQDGVITLRNQLGETGSLPRSYTAGSPDIISAGTKPFNPVSDLEKEANYGNAYDNSLYINQPNYFYVRGKNFGKADVTGQWNLFWATPNILLYPFLWQENQLATSGGNQSPAFAIKAGMIGCSTDAFTWVPPDTSDHYCMIAVALSAGFPNPLEGVNNVASLAETMAGNANIAQRNMQLIRGAVPQMVSKAAYSHGDVEEVMDLVVKFSNVPKGSNYTVSSGDQLDGKSLFLEGKNTTTSDFKVGWTDRKVPANWATMFDYTITFGNDWSEVPQGARPTLTIKGEVVLGSEHRLYNHPAARLAGPCLQTGQRRVDRLGQDYKVMTAGSVSTMCVDLGP